MPSDVRYTRQTPEKPLILISRFDYADIQSMVKHMQACKPLKDAPMVAVTLGRDPLQMALDMPVAWMIHADDLAKGDGQDEEESDDETTSEDEEDSSESEVGSENASSSLSS
jgi:hypothetical protein